VPAGERVEAVVAGGGDITIDGSVKGSVVAFGGDVLVRGTVGNNIVAFGGDVRLAPTAVVGSTMSPQDKSIVLFGGTLTRGSGAQVTGDVQRFDNANWVGALNWATQHTVIRPWWGFTLMGWIVQTPSSWCSLWSRLPSCRDSCTPCSDISPRSRRHRWAGERSRSS